MGIFKNPADVLRETQQRQDNPHRSPLVFSDVPVREACDVRIMTQNDLLRHCTKSKYYCSHGDCSPLLMVNRYILLVNHVLMGLIRSV